MGEDVEWVTRCQVGGGVEWESGCQVGEDVEWVSVGARGWRC